MEKLLLVQLLVDRGMDVDEAYNLVFGFGLVEEEVFDGVGIA